MDIEQMRIRMGEMAAEIERLQSIIDEQQSPAVAAPDDVRMNAKLYDDNDVQVILTECSEAIGCAPLTNLWQISRMISSPRITEQDAREILEGFCKFGHYSSEIGAFLGDSDCRALLAKLNEVNNEKAN